jgi:hypothetical protein
MPREIDERNRWCATFAAILVEEARVPTSDALFLAEQARVCLPGLPPSYAVRLALHSPQARVRRLVAGRWWGASASLHKFGIDDSAVGW